jgi:hypothetical protein
MTKAFTVFTHESVEDVIRQGGSGNWVTRAARLGEYSFAVLTRNSRHPSAPADVAHGSAFLVGRIARVREINEIAGNGKPRVFMEFSAYAEIDVPNAWGKSTNPVWYTDLATLGILESDLEFHPLNRSVAENEAEPKDHSQIIEAMRKQIAVLHGVLPSRVDISIRL